MNRKSRNIVITSVLKPINDIRLYEKFALSINNLDNNKIHIVAHKSILRPQSDNIKFYPIFNFSRLSWKRFLVGILYLKTILKIKPSDIIISTHELLFPSIFYKLFTKVNLYYDVRENYYSNIKNTNTFPPIIRSILAFYVRLKENIAAPFIKHFFLAERSYANELPFIGEKYSIIENKFIGEANLKTKPIPDAMKFVYTGTIGETYGTLEGIQFIKKLYQYDSNISLTIVGFCSQNSYLHKVKEAIADCSYIQLIGGDILIPHSQILEVLNTADIALLPYLSNPSTDKCIPTKLYECIALKIPVLIPNNPLWISMIEEYNAGICIDFVNVPSEEILKSFKKDTFYDKGDFSNILWESESLKLKDNLKWQK